MLKLFQEKFKNHRSEIQNFLQSKKQNLKGPIYSSVDLRNSGFKISAIDTNIFPAGWNNLCHNYGKEASQKFKDFFENKYPNASKIIIFPEAHTKNLYYFENLRQLQIILQNASFEVKIALTSAEFDETKEFLTSENVAIKLHNIEKINNKIQTKCGFMPDIIISNNDFSDGIPEILMEIDQEIVPNPQLGWFRRSKFENVKIYQQLIEEFAKIIDLDPWYFYPISETVEGVDFQSKQGMEEITDRMNKIIIQLEKKYNEYPEIKEKNIKPYLFVKNAAGTYGIGVSHFDSVEEFLNMNRKERNKLSVGKGNQNISKIIIQEGIQTIDRYKDFIAEPVIYLVNSSAIGGFFRLNDQRSDKENLNAKGMQFSKLCFHEMSGYHNLYDETCELASLKNIYYTIAEIASIAAGIEEQNLCK